MPAKRLFIAVNISDEARRRAAAHIDKLRVSAKDVRVGWERPEKLHITLKFLGNVEDNLVAKVSDAAASVAAIFKPFRLAVVGTGLFPRIRQPRVLWLGIKNDDGSLRTLAVEIDMRLSQFGFVPEARPFSPHLTIARIRDPQKAKRLAESHLQSRFESVRFSVKELVVYESQPNPTGSVYRVVSRHAL